MEKSPKKTSRLSEEEQLEQAYDKIAEKKKNRKKHGIGKIIAVILCCCLIVGGIWFGIHYYSTYMADPYICQNVFAAGVPLGGLTRDEAAAALQSAADTYASQDLIVNIRDTKAVLSPFDTGAQLDINHLIKDAFLYGKKGTASQKEEARKQAEQYGYHMETSRYLNLNLTYIQQVVDKLSSMFNAAFVPSGCTVTGNRPVPGPDTAGKPGQTLVITMGSPEMGLNDKALYNHILAAYDNCEFSITEECTYLEPDPIDLDSLAKQYCSKPSDAVMDPETFEVTEAVYGYGFDYDAAKAQLTAAQYGDTVKIPMNVIAPEITTESLSSMLYRDELAAVSTKHTDDEDRNTNLRLACKAIDGMILYPGDIFSYNDALGERTEEKGYRPGASYAGGEVVYTYGGGICQVSSSLYYAALQADMEIVERDCHMFPPSYIPYGMDATVNWGTIDFQFRNNTDYPVRIEANVADGCVNVKLIGTDEKSYYVKMEYEVDEVYNWQTVYKEYPPDNDKGYTDGEILTYPADGYGVSTYRCKYDKETDELLSRDYETFSSYDRQDKEICRIVYPDTPAESDDSHTGGYGPIGEATG